MPENQEPAGASPAPSPPVEALIGFAGTMHVVDIGAAAINETPAYRPLLDRGLARLTAVDGDERQLAGIATAYPGAHVVAAVLGDGTRRTIHLARPNSGMTSLLKPSPRHLGFFNRFDYFGEILSVEQVDTVRLADVEALQAIDYLKMDIQGAELLVLNHAGAALDRCIAIQLEASFVPLYEDQPSFGDVDLWMRARGFLPHCFVDVKRWSIAPTLRGKDPRLPFNQLLECDIVYVRGLVDFDSYGDDQLRMLALIAAYAYRSPDLAVRAVLELERRGTLAKGTAQRVASAAPKWMMNPNRIP